MSDTSEVHRVTINQIRGCLVATIQFDLRPEVLERFRKDLLERVDASRVREVILDCSGIEVLDAEDFDALRRIIAVVGLTGTRTVLAGLQPGVVSALIDLNVEIDGLHTVLTLDDAFRLPDTGDENGAVPPDPACGEGDGDVASR